MLSSTPILGTLTLKDLKSIYNDLQRGRAHRYDCGCAACLYDSIKKQNPKLRADKDNFFLSWLAFHLSEKRGGRGRGIFVHNRDLKRKWEDIIEFYIAITGNKNRANTYFKKNHPDRPEHYQIIYRYDNRYNVSKIVRAKEQKAEMIPFSISPFICEVQCWADFLSYKYKANFLPAVLMDEKTLFFFHCIIYYSYLALLKLLQKDSIKTKRDLYRSLHLERQSDIDSDDLLLILDYLSLQGIIKIDNKIRRPKNFESLGKAHINRIEFALKSLQEIYPFKISDALKLFKETLQHKNN